MSGRRREVQQFLGLAVSAEWEPLQAGRGAEMEGTEVEIQHITEKRHVLLREKPALFRARGEITEVSHLESIKWDSCLTLTPKFTPDGPDI